MNTEQKAREWLAEYGDGGIPTEIITALLAERQALLDAAKCSLAATHTYGRNTAGGYLKSIDALEKAIAMCEDKK